MQTLPQEADVSRDKDIKFFLNKLACAIVQLIFFIYEIAQVRNEGSEYFEDFWNYFELTGMFLFFWAAYLDITLPFVTHQMRILFSQSVLMCLVKIVYLIRVFKQLNFLVTMIITVCKNIVFFMILFSIFLLTFAQCTMLMQVDISAYGRIPSLMAHFIAMLRCSMGDFSLIDPWETFDTFKTNDDGVKEYNHQLVYINFTWLIWSISIVFLFMIFMNFIIAVIGDTYSGVIQYKEAHDYQ